MRALVVVAMLLTGCAMMQENLPPARPDFFACNYWIDKNQNGKIEDDEWEGIKFDFRESEHISFVAYFYQKPGTPLSFKLIAPDGSVYKEKTLKQTAKKTVWCQEYEARDLVKECGEGVWNMEWYVEGRIVNITTIRILK
ncbi:MAG: hypothetical protein NC825_02440 [Candidatus Omnitrophica bacterium]|nr:hypothetical protein [Candidatus Omnitrophota bacterium]